MDEFEFSPAVVRLARAVRFAIVALMLCPFYFNVRASLNIGDFHTVCRDMLGGKPLPPVTEFVFAVRFVLLASSILVPSLAAATLFSSRLVASFYVIGVLSLVTVAQFVLLFQALSAPLATITAQMQGG